MLLTPGAGGENEVIGSVDAVACFDAHPGAVGCPASYFFVEVDRRSVLTRLFDVADDAGLASQKASIRLVQRDHAIVEANAGKALGQVVFTQDDAEPAGEGGLDAGAIAG